MEMGEVCGGQKEKARHVPSVFSPRFSPQHHSACQLHLDPYIDINTI